MEENSLWLKGGVQIGRPQSNFIQHLEKFTFDLQFQLGLNRKKILGEFFAIICSCANRIKTKECLTTTI